MSLTKTAIDRYIGYCWGFATALFSTMGYFELSILSMIGFTITTVISMVQANKEELK